MKDFIKNASWVDWVLVSVGITLLLGFALFIIGFYWGFDAASIFADNAGVEDLLGKTSVSKVLAEKSTLIAGKLTDMGVDTTNLFTLAGSIDSSFGPLYGMVVTSVLGFSFIMLGLASLVIMFALSVFMDYILPKIKAKKQK